MEKGGEVWGADAQRLPVVGKSYINYQLSITLSKSVDLIRE